VPLSPEPGEPYASGSRQARIGPLLGAEKLGASVYELELGQRTSAFHYEHGSEEWLLVLDGRPTLRDTEGEHVLVPGDIVCFPCGPEGAHEVNNASGAPARVLIFSTSAGPSVTSYPDHGTLLVTPPGKLFREADAITHEGGEPDD
jgi:uncharacterized cupin superfamily protein